MEQSCTNLQKDSMEAEALSREVQSESVSDSLLPASSAATIIDVNSCEAVRPTGGAFSEFQTSQKPTAPHRIGQGIQTGPHRRGQVQKEASIRDLVQFPPENQVLQPRLALLFAQSICEFCSKGISIDPAFEILSTVTRLRIPEPRAHRSALLQDPAPPIGQLPF